MTRVHRVLAAFLLFSGTAGFVEPAQHAPKPESEFRVVPLGPAKGSGMIISGKPNQLPSPPVVGVFVPEEPELPEGWRRIAVRQFSFDAPPELAGGATGADSMAFESTELTLRLKADPRAVRPRCTFGRWCERDYSHVIHGVVREAALEDWTRAGSKQLRPWRYEALRFNTYDTRHPFVAIEARCTTRTVCAGVEQLLAKLRLADTGAPMVESDHVNSAEPQYQSPAAYRRGAHTRHAAATPAGWRRIDEDRPFSVALPKSLPFEWESDGHGGPMLIVETKEMEFRVSYTRFSRYPQCQELVRCIRRRALLDGLPATEIWEDYASTDKDTQHINAMKKKGTNWAFEVGTALPASGAGPFSSQYVVSVWALCRTRQVCQRARKIADTVEIR